MDGGTNMKINCINLAQGKNLTMGQSRRSVIVCVHLCVCAQVHALILNVKWKIICTCSTPNMSTSYQIPNTALIIKEFFSPF